MKEATSDRFRLTIFERQNLAYLADKYIDNRRLAISVVSSTFKPMFSDLEERIKNSDKSARDSS